MPWMALAAASGDSSEALPDRLAWQIALDREGFSPGLVDGRVGGKTRLATAEFQKSHGLPATGNPDDATLTALKVDASTAISEHLVEKSDLENITPLTEDWNERAQQAVMGYYTPLDGLAERFHTSKALLEALNPDVDFNTIQAGTPIRVPGIIQPVSVPKASSLRVDLPKKVIYELDANGRVIGLVHCSIAANVEKRPSGETTILTVIARPNYTFDPKNWPEVHNVDKVLIIPPGPRNPVGLAWIGLNLPGYGMHGTPHPEMIGKTGSHGCFRLANWDAVRLSKMVKVGQRVEFVNKAPATTNRPAKAERDP